MNLPQLENQNAVKNAIAVLRRARRRYSAAIARIRRMEKFLEKHVAGLGLELEHLYGEIEPFECPPEPVIVGLTRHLPQKYVLFFARRDGEWHFYLAPTVSNPSGGTLTMSDEAIPLVRAPAGVVLYCVNRIEIQAIDILEHLAAIVAASSSEEVALAHSEKGKKVLQDPPKRTIH